MRTNANACAHIGALALCNPCGLMIYNATALMRYTLRVMIYNGTAVDRGAPWAQAMLAQ